MARYKFIDMSPRLLPAVLGSNARSTACRRIYADTYDRDAVARRPRFECFCRPGPVFAQALLIMPEVGPSVSLVVHHATDSAGETRRSDCKNSHFMGVNCLRPQRPDAKNPLSSSHSHSAGLRCLRLHPLSKASKIIDPCQFKSGATSHLQHAQAQEH